jgi:F0F1-type ATP synthase epsilon subunit
MEKKSTLELEIIKPAESKRVSVLWLEVEGLTGSFVVGPDHVPLVSILKPKARLIYKTKENLEVEMDTFGGIIVVTAFRVVIVLDA